MTRRRTNIGSRVVVALLTAASAIGVGCDAGSGAPGNGGAGAASASKPSEPAEAPVLPADVPIPTADEADAAAERDITQENADEVFERLRRDIDRELDGG